MSVLETAKQRQYRELLEAETPLSQICQHMNVQPAAVYAMASRLGLSVNGRRTVGRPARGEGGDKAVQKRMARQEKALQRVKDRRRFKHTPVPTGSPARALSPDSDAIRDGRTMFPSRVFEVTRDETVLKDGASQSKIGGDVLVGRLKGARILTLTLEERATCPRTCQVWSTCYGNGMQYARRWRSGRALEAKIAAELHEYCRIHKTVLVRLHILGDFYSDEYLLLWRDLLTVHRNLHVFGFTAHQPSSRMGEAIACMREEFGLRFAMRHSGRTGEWGSFTIDFPTERKMIGDAVVCPEQRDAMDGGGRGIHCGNCAICWSSGAPVCFVEH